jgi:hypothetical protein
MAEQEDREIFRLPGNKKNLEALAEFVRRKQVAPFLGAGFSAPACPTWASFLETLFLELEKEDLITSEEEKKAYLEYKDKNAFEHMAGKLYEFAGKLRFKQAIKEHFGKPTMLNSMRPKFRLLHRVFTGLKITTNFDCFIEDFDPPNVEVWRGGNSKDLERLMIGYEGNGLLKIHGGLKDMASVVLSAGQYETVYGHATGFSPDALLPKALQEVFTRFSLLFIGCSLHTDRTLMVLRALEEVRPHFAVMKMPADKQEKGLLKRRLNDLQVQTVWITDFKQIEEILAFLCGEFWPGVCTNMGYGAIDHGVAFVGREKELKTIAGHMDTGKGGVHMITGRLFSIDGAGGVGKTTLALEAAKQLAKEFKDGVIGPIRADEYTPMSFAMHLASLLDLKPAEPPDKESSRALVTAMLKERRALLVLDNAIDWESLVWMLPSETACMILVTTRDRDMYDRLRLKCPGLPMHKINLERFTRDEALALFRRVLGDGYEEGEEGVYLEIAGNLGFLPLALRQALSLMRFGPHYTAEALRDRLAGEGRLEVLRKGAAETGSDERTVESVFDLSTGLLTGELTEALEYLSVCAPGPAPLDFLLRLCKNPDIAEHLERLHTLSWSERRESEGKRSYELHQLVRELVRRRFGLRFRRDLIAAVHEVFTDEEVHFSVKDAFMHQLEEALVLAGEDRDERLKEWMYNHSIFYFCAYRGYGDFFIRLTQRVEELFPDDRWTLRAVYSHRALILSDWGQLEGAMSLHKKEEKIKEELDNRAGLAVCYNNQALILMEDKKFNQALNLLTEEEQICTDLNHLPGMARAWSNQKDFYKAQGDLDTTAKLWRKAIDMNKRMGIPVEDEEKELRELEELKSRRAEKTKKTGPPRLD